MKNNSSQVKIDQDAVRSLAELLRDTDLTEIEYQVDSLRIRVVRAVQHNVTSVSLPTEKCRVLDSSDEKIQESSKNPEDIFMTHSGRLDAQMVGTIYLSPGPDAEPFIKVGNHVEQGQTLFIIEAMKVMNMIKAQKSGTVEHIFVTDGQPVEYGDPILVIG